MGGATKSHFKEKKSLGFKDRWTLVAFFKACLINPTLFITHQLPVPVAKVEFLLYRKGSQEPEVTVRVRRRTQLDRPWVPGLTGNQQAILPLFSALVGGPTVSHSS